ncbi:MAG TPA: AAC(3) family N-acetyltransferase [Solirubrobacteraceae bacterium]|nr:AAC(3) family N-acetyltransferase [Solirubrobacteraceae bacterium]
MSRLNLTSELRELGVDEGDVLMVHASLRAMGSVEGGAAGVVSALETAVGPLGTLVMNLCARDDFDWVNARPETERPLLLRAAPAFDKNRTPADPDVGVLAEVFRQLPGTLVNDHPDGRFGARGRLSAALLQEPLPWDDYYGPGSTLERLVMAGAKILRLGADYDTVTLLHLAEYYAELPFKRRVCRHHKVLLPNGTETVRTVTCLDDTSGIAEWDDEDYFATILHDYLARGRAIVGRVGDARAELIDAADFVQHGASWMSQHLARR